MEWQRNNLDLSNNPYLRQHAENPVHWQEWSQEALEHARRENKPILVSIGYSTCHWCHVMAAEAFSDEECAAILNEEFVSIKVDRETRPDIDQYLMSFLVATTGSGGWPLNAFLTPAGDPFFAMTYAAVEPRFGRQGFADILQQVRSFATDRAHEVSPFQPATQETGPTLDTHSAEAGSSANGARDELALAARRLHDAFDAEHPGFGHGQKFPPHGTLLFMLHAAAAGNANAGADANPTRDLLSMATRTLDAMQDGGLHDHLGGGFFRYCVDRAWTVPHFEKMLYDQAMMLWNYSVAAALTGSKRYAETARGVFACLEDSFRSGSLYAAAHDADTLHEEGGTYLWGEAELAEILTAPQSEALAAAFRLVRVGEDGNRGHLLRHPPPELADARPPAHPENLHDARERLLEMRRARPQPFRDDKLLANWNALAGMALLAAHRHLAFPGALERAREVAAAILNMTTDGVVPHDLRDGNAAGPSYLTDHAAVLLFLEMLAEEPGEPEESTERDGIRSRLSGFRDRHGGWIEAISTDFRPVAAGAHDQPVPSGISLAAAAGVVRAHRTGSAHDAPGFKDPLGYGFHNVAALMAGGFFHVVTAPDTVAWMDLPVNTVRLRGNEAQTCFMGACRRGLPSTAHRG